MDLVVVLVIGCCSILAVLALGLVGMIGVLGVFHRIVEWAVETDMDGYQESPQRTPEREDGV